MSELIKALATALPEVEGATKDKANPHFRAKYADLGNVIEAIRPVRKHGLWFRQAPVEHAGGACIETFYVHSSGEQMSAGVCFVPASKNDAQGFGSALTYCRRYGLLAAFGIAPEDDDGNAASKRGGQSSDSEVSRPAPPSSDPIDETQFGVLQALIETSGADIMGICKASKVAALNQLNAADFPRLRAQLEKKLEAKNGVSAK
jgi:hypothetical protein